MTEQSSIDDLLSLKVLENYITLEKRINQEIHKLQQEYKSKLEKFYDKAPIVLKLITLGVERNRVLESLSKLDSVRSENITISDLLAIRHNVIKKYTAKQKKVLHFSFSSLKPKSVRLVKAQLTRSKQRKSMISTGSKIAHVNFLLQTMLSEYSGTKKNLRRILLRLVPQICEELTTVGSTGFDDNDEDQALLIQK